MKTINNNKQFSETFAKYLSGEMSAAELNTFENEMALSGEDKISIEKMKKQWSDMKGYSAPKTPDIIKAWSKLQARLSGENLIPSDISIARPRFVSVILKVAAGMLILIGIAAVIYFQMNSKPTIEMVKVSTGNEANTLVKTLKDGSIIYIARNSLFSFPKEFENDSRNVVLKGEAFFDIAPNSKKPFIIETNEALIEVLGTAFNVKTHNDTDFELFVARGKVKVTLKQNPSHYEFVVAGEKVKAVKNNIIKTKHIVNQEYTWYRRHLQFKDESLLNIINVLNRNFNTTFAVSAKETGNRRLTVTFDKETAETMTELLCVTLNLKSQKLNGSVVLSENKENARKN